MSESREFKDIRRSGPVAQAKPVDDFMDELETLQTEICHGQEHGVGGGGRRKPVGGVPAPFRQGVLLPGPLVHVGIRVTGGQRPRHRRRIAGRQRALRATGCRTWPTRPGTPGDANHVDMKIEWAHQLGHHRRGARHLRAHARDDRHRLHDALLHASLLRGGTGRLRLGRRALRGVHGLRPEDVRGHARPLRDRGGELPGPRLRRGGPRRAGRLSAAPGGRHRRPAAPDPARHRAHLLGPQPAHGGAQPLARRARACAADRG